MPYLLLLLRLLFLPFFPMPLFHCRLPRKETPPQNNEISCAMLYQFYSIRQISFFNRLIILFSKREI